MRHFDGHILNHGNSLHDGHTPISHDIPMNHDVFFCDFGVLKWIVHGIIIITSFTYCDNYDTMNNWITSIINYKYYYIIITAILIEYTIVVFA